jgi:hypothetical protein
VCEEQMQFVSNELVSPCLNFLFAVTSFSKMCMCACTEGKINWMEDIDNVGLRFLV